MNPLAFQLTYSLPEVVPPRMTVGQTYLPDLNAYPVLDGQTALTYLNVRIRTLGLFTQLLYR